MSEVDVSTEILNLNPSQDLYKKGYDNGSLFALYNFVNYELDSTPLETYFVSEISSDRTEVRLSNNFLSNDQISSSYAEFKEKLNSSEFFDEFYVAFSGNNYNIGINCILDTSKEKTTVLVKLYDALPTQYKVKDEVYILTKTAETKLYKVNQSTSNPSTDALAPSTIFSDGFELDNQSIIPNEDIKSTFTPDENNIEFYIYDINLNLIASDLNFTDYTITGPGLVDSDAGTGVCSLGPQFTTQEDCTAAGGTWTSTNGGTCSLGPQFQTEKECTEAGGIWTSNIESANGVCSLGPEFPTKEACEAAGGQWTPSSGVCSLGPQYTTQAACLAAGGIWSSNRPGVCTLGPQYTTQFACIAAGGIWHNSEIFGDATFLRGPNTNLEIKDFVNNSTVFKTKNDLVNSPSTSSRNNLDYYLNQKGVTITPDYSKFDEFVNFSSAKQRLQNFYYKVQQIEAFEDELNILNSISGSTSESISVTSNKSSIETNISNIIKNFDGYEYYLYYIDEPSSYPKTGSKFPFELKDTDSTDVLTWLGSDDEKSQYYGGQILSASFYDQDNQNWLFYTIPGFIRDNEENDNYLTFCNMVGQSFDEIWLYTKAVSQKSNTTNQLDRGVPLDLAQPTIESLGYKGFGNNYNNQDNYIGLTGEDNGVFVPPTGSELIKNYIAINGGSVINYWEDNYSFTGYVEEFIEEGFPYAIDRVSKEIYKRLYHNMAYLVKKKGTTAGLRQLINIWGIPSTILRINEFGGKDKDNSDDYDLWYNRYSYAYTPVGTQLFPSASLVIPWLPLLRNKIADSANIVPDGISFRFKTQGIPKDDNRGTYYTQSLLVKKSDNDPSNTEVDFGIRLTYEPQVTGSYPGAEPNEFNKYGRLQFYISGLPQIVPFTGSNDGIYLPFFDGEWWTVSLSRDFHADASVNTNDTLFTLRAANNIYNGDDGDRIGFKESSSVNALGLNNYGTGLYGIALYGGEFSFANFNWNAFGSGSFDGVYLGGTPSGSTINGIVMNEPGKMFVGSFQEFRYYSHELKEEVFNDLVMNPESIEGNAITGEQSSFDIVNFRAPLGNELESNFYVSTSLAEKVQPFFSLHPAISGEAPQLITQSFFIPSTGVTSSKYNLYYNNPGTYEQTLSLINREPYLLDQPAIGITNRITNKIQIQDTTDFGNILSSQISIEQDYLISRSYTEDINSLEVGFSPTDEVNDDIIATYGHGVIGDAIADPRFTQEKTEFYPRLVEIEKDYLKKYTKGNVQDYIRLIKYVDDSLFKSIKAYVPARTSVTTGIIIKQNMLDRSRAIPTTVDADTKIAVTPETGSVVQGTPQTGYNSPIIKRDLTLTASIDVEGKAIDGLTFGGTGGTFERFNYYGAATTNEKTGEPGTTKYPELPGLTQSYIDSFDTIAGQQNITESTQAEFYTGEFEGSAFPAVTQSLFNNPFAAPNPVDTTYDSACVVKRVKHCDVFTELKICRDNDEALGYLTSSMANVDQHIRVALVGETMIDEFENDVFAYLYVYGFRFPETSVDGINIGNEIFKPANPGNNNIKAFPQPSAEYPWRTQDWMQDANGNANIYPGNTGYPFFQFTLAQIVNDENGVTPLADNFDNGYDTGTGVPSNNAFKYDVYRTWKFPSYITNPSGGPLLPFAPVPPVEDIVNPLDFSSNTFISTALPIEKIDVPKRIVTVKPPFPHLDAAPPNSFLTFSNWDDSRNSNHRGIIAGYHLMGPDFKNSTLQGDGMDVPSTKTCRLYYMETIDNIEFEKNSNLKTGMPKGETTSTLVESCWYYFDPTSNYKTTFDLTKDNNIVGLPVGYSSEFLWLYSFFSSDTYDGTPGIDSTNILPTLTSPNFSLPFVPIPNTLNEFYWRTTGDFTSPPRYEILNGDYELVKVTTTNLGLTRDSVMYIGLNPVTGKFTNPLQTSL